MYNRCMIRTQINLPDPLYYNAKRVAKQLDWSLAEVIRRGVEQFTAYYPEQKDQTWTFPEPFNLGVPLIDIASLNPEADAIEAKFRA